MFFFIDGPALVCGWVNFPILWPHTPVQTKLKCPLGLLSEQKLQRNLVLVNDLFKSKGSAANCMTNRVPVHTGNASGQFLHRNIILILVHTVQEQLLKRSKKLSGTV